MTAMADTATAEEIVGLGSGFRKTLEDNGTMEKKATGVGFR